MSLIDAIMGLGRRESFTVYRPASPELVRGRVVRGEPCRFDAEGAVFQADPATLQALPEGLRNREALNLWTDCELRTADALATREADKIELCRQTQGGDPEKVLFEVNRVNDRRREGGYVKAVIVRVGQ
jgi:hypothetical protein